MEDAYITMYQSQKKIHEIQSDNPPQFASDLFAEFVKDWNIKYSTSSHQVTPGTKTEKQNLVKIVKGLFSHAMCPVQDLTLLAYRGMPADSHL